MIKICCFEIKKALLAADTQAALKLLEDSHCMFLDPLEGPSILAEILYVAIKKSNREVIQFLLNLPAHCDIAFYNYCGQTPVACAFDEGLKDLLPLILEKTDKDFALFTAVQLKNNVLQNLLLKSCRYKEKLLRYLGLQNK